MLVLDFIVRFMIISSVGYGLIQGDFIKDLIDLFKF